MDSVKSFLITPTAKFLHNLSFIMCLEESRNLSILFAVRRLCLVFRDNAVLSVD